MIRIHDFQHESNRLHQCGRQAFSQNKTVNPIEIDNVRICFLNCCVQTKEFQLGCSKCVQSVLSKEADHQILKRIFWAGIGQNQNSTEISVCQFVYLFIFYDVIKPLQFVTISNSSNIVFAYTDLGIFLKTYIIACRKIAGFSI